MYLSCLFYFVINIVLIILVKLYLYRLHSTSFYSCKYDADPCHLSLCLFQYHCYYLEHSSNVQQDLTSWTSCKNTISYFIFISEQFLCLKDIALRLFNKIYFIFEQH